MPAGSRRTEPAGFVGVTPAAGGPVGAVMFLQCREFTLDSLFQSGLEAAQQAVRSGDISDALTIWADLRVRFPARPEAYLQAAATHREAGNFDEADTLLADALSRLPNDSDLLFDYARIAEARRDDSEAVRRWELTCLGAPGHWLSHVGLMNTLMRLGRMEAAEAAGFRASELLPLEPNVYFAWAECAARGHRPEQAAKRYRTAVTANPDHPPLIHRLLDQLVLLERRQEAAAVVDEALAKWPGDPHFLRTKVRLALRARDFESALNALDSLGADPALGRERLLLAFEIFKAQPPEPIAVPILSLLVAEPDSGDRSWLPLIAHIPENPPFLAWVKDLLKRYPQPSASPALTVAQSMSGFTFTDVEILEFIEAYVAKGRSPLYSRIFSFLYYMFQPGETERVGALFLAWLKADLDSQLVEEPANPIRLISCLIFGAIFSEPAHRLVVERIGRLVGSDWQDRGNSCLDDPLDIMRSVAASAPALLTGNGEIRRTAAPRRGRLRIALCISGQLRGYREASPSWSALGLDDHDVTRFVHTWREVGQNWERIWDCLRHDREMHDAISRLGPNWIRKNYPKLATAIENAMSAGAYVSEQQLRDFYHTDFIRVEDDQFAPFAGKTNTWKMHYKIYATQTFAKSSGKEFDLYIKIRPDQLLRDVGKIDWTEIFQESHEKRALYADRPYQFTGEIIKAADQFIAGTCEPMDAYASVFTRANLCAQTGRQMFDAPDFFRPHATVGFSTVYQGVLMRSMPGVIFERLLNSTIIAPHQILSLLRSDVTNRAPIDFDREFVPAITVAVEKWERENLFQ
jgi:tetratricopeptide (TPR) repeat protein